MRDRCRSRGVGRCGEQHIDTQPFGCTWVDRLKRCQRLGIHIASGNQRGKLMRGRARERLQRAAKATIAARALRRATPPASRCGWHPPQEAHVRRMQARAWAMRCTACRRASADREEANAQAHGRHAARKHWRPRRSDPQTRLKCSSASLRSTSRERGNDMFAATNRSKHQSTACSGVDAASCGEGGFQSQKMAVSAPR